MTPFSTSEPSSVPSEPSQSSHAQPRSSSASSRLSGMAVHPLTQRPREPPQVSQPSPSGAQSLLSTPVERRSLNPPIVHSAYIVRLNQSQKSLTCILLRRVVAEGW